MQAKTVLSGLATVLGTHYRVAQAALRFGGRQSDA